MLGYHFTEPTLSSNPYLFLVNMVASSLADRIDERDIKRESEIFLIMNVVKSQVKLGVEKS